MLVVVFWVATKAGLVGWVMAQSYSGPWIKID